MKKHILVFLLLFAALAAGFSATINAVASGNWSDPSTWDAGRVPAEGDIVQINNNYTVTVDQSYTYTNLSISIGWSGSLTVPSDITLTVSQFSSSNGGGNPVQIDGRLNVAGDFSQTGGTVNIGLSGYVYVTGDYTTSGGSAVTLNVNGTLETSTFTVSSITVNVGAQGKIIVNSDFVNQSGATFNLNGGEFHIKGNYDNQGNATITLNDDALLHIYGDYLNAGGSDIIVNKGTVIIDGNVDNRGGSTFTIADGSYVEVNGDLSNTGGGNITVDGSLYVEGDLTNKGGGTIDGTGSLYVGGNVDDPQNQIDPNLMLPKSFHNIASGTWLDPNIWSTTTDDKPCNCTPPINSDITLAPNTQVVINNTVKVNSVFIDEGAQLTLDANANVTVFKQLTINGTLVLQNDLTSSPNLVEQGTVSYGPQAQIVNKLTVAPKQYNYIGSFIPGVSTDALETQTNANVLQYDETKADNWLDSDPANDYLGWVQPAATMEPAQGFIVYIDQEKTYTLTGQKLNLEDVQVNVTNTVHSEFAESDLVDGWNLVANPFPSSIDAQTFLNDNSAVLDGNIYLWDDDNSNGADYSTNDYIQYNKTGSIVNSANGASFDGFIAPNQAFFVKALTNRTVNFTYSQRSGNNATLVKSVTQETVDDLKKLRLSMFDAETKNYNEILVAFSRYLTDQWDYGYDGLKKKGNANLAFYSLQGQKELGIQALSDSFTVKVIDLGYEVGNSGTYTIKLKDYNIPLNYRIYLYDKQTGTKTNLMHQSYSFTSDAGVYNERFSLIVEKVEIFAATEQIDENYVKIFVTGRQLVVKNLTQEELKAATLTVFDLLGRVVVKENVDLGAGEQFVMPLKDFASGTYIAQIKNNGLVETAKFVILR